MEISHVVVLIAVWLGRGVVGGPGTTPNIQEIFTGRCWEYMEITSARLVKPTKLDCDALWDSFTSGFTFKDPRDIRLQDYQPFFDEAKQTIPENTGLRPGTRYYYKVVSVCPTNTTDRSESSIYDFNTVSPKQIGVSRFLVYGDMGAGLNIPTYGPLEKYIRSRDYSAIWHVGDLAYDLHSENGKTGDLFLQRIQPFAAYVPYMTLPGNHEIPMHFHHYRARFSTPGNPWPIPINRMWYSYDVGLVHFVSFSTEVYFTYEGVFACEQFYWLLHDLQVANQNREKTPWIVAMGHRPMYCSNRGGDDCTNTHTNRWVKHGTHYKRNLTVHNRDMHAVEELHPAIYQEFAHGHFVGQKTCHAFSSIALDQVYEQLIGELKGNGAGVIGLTVNPSELRRYLIASHMSLNNQLKVQTNGIMNSTLSFNVTSRQISKQWWMNVSTLETPSLKIPVS